MVPLVTSTVLATVGPFIYLFIQNRAEDKLLQEQRRYQATLRQASAGMGKIKDLKRLVTLIVHIMTRTVRVEFSMVFLNDVYAKKFRLGAYRSRTARVKFRSDIDNATAVVQILKETQGPIVYDEIKQRTQDYGDLKLARLEAELKAMDAALVVPSFIDEKLVAILVMGNKISGKTYSSDDLSVFTIFSQQVALALRNLRAMEEVKKAQEQLFHSEKLAYIGQLAATVAHEVRNPLTAIKTFVNYLPEKFRTHDVEFLQRFENLIPGEILRIEKIVHQLIDLARPRQAHKSQESIGEILARTLDLLKDNIAMRNIRLEKEMTDKDDRVLCDAEQIQQVMLNLILNALDVMSDGGKLTVKLWGQQQEDGRWVMFSVRDTGCGISPENLKKLFTPFQTTKPKGLGLGLVIVEEIVKLHQGKITATSQLGQGTEFVVSLPA